MCSSTTLRACTALVLTLTLGSCSRSSGSSGAPARSATTERRAVLVTIGSAATFGDGLANKLRDSWPQKLYHEAFPTSTVLVNASDRAVTVGRALGQPLALALEVHATVVAVWLGDTDASVENFGTSLDLLVERLRDSGARVLLGNLSRDRAGDAAANDAIARIARARGATLVDLTTALSGTPGVGPSSLVDVATSRKIAEAFAAALAPS